MTATRPRGKSPGTTGFPGLDTAPGVNIHADASQGSSATSFVIFDLETTGLYPGSCEIIQIAGIRFQERGMAPVRPVTSIDP